MYKVYNFNSVEAFEDSGLNVEAWEIRNNMSRWSIPKNKDGTITIINDFDILDLREFNKFKYDL